MGLRFQKSVKIAKGVKVNVSKSGASLSLGGKGKSLNIGKSGVRGSVGLPGTGLSYSKTLISAKDIKNFGKGKGKDSKDTKAKSKTSAAEQKKQALEEKKLQAQEVVENAAEENAKFLQIHTFAPVVSSKSGFEKEMKNLEPEKYDVPKPSREAVAEELEKEAEKKITGFFFKKKKRKEYVKDKLELRYATYLDEWTAAKEEVEADSVRECERKKEIMASLLEGDDETICEVFNDWISSCELPVEININYDWDAKNKIMLLDVDLPEIEDLPETTMSVSAKGDVKEKKKTQGDIRDEYAKCVFGVAVFITASVFDISPSIDRVLISGYTQRRDTSGARNNDYIYSIKFPREVFEGKDVSRKDPENLCLNQVNRCVQNATGLFKAIEPFESYDEA